MIILDSDHLSVLRYHHSERALKLIARLNQAPEKPIATSIANVEEAMRDPGFRNYSNGFRLCFFPD
jgi:hypothetical protein